MEIKADDVVTLRHYSGVNPFKSLVVAFNGEVVSIRLTKEFAIMNFLEGDPVVLGYESKGQIRIVGCVVTKIAPRDSIIQLKIDKVDLEAEKRMYERFPVSLYSDIRVKGMRKKHLATIKDLSYYGMLVYSKDQLELNQEIELDIYLDKTMLFLKGCVVRKEKGQYYFEYGLRIMYEDNSSMNFMKEYLKRLREAQEESIRKLRNL